jgi:hypothetical protein
MHSGMLDGRVLYLGISDHRSAVRPHHGYRGPMVQLRRNEDGRWVEVGPMRCGNGHALGVGRMSNSIDEHPIHKVRVRS